jgi:hypothetical protein
MGDMEVLEYLVNGGTLQVLEDPRHGNTRTTKNPGSTHFAGNPLNGWTL